jgi:hypothetical protein
LFLFFERLKELISSKEKFEKQSWSKSVEMLQIIWSENITIIVDITYGIPGDIDYVVHIFWT